MKISSNWCSDITLQIAAGIPFVVSRDQVPAAVLAKEKEIAAEQVKNKPPQAIAKIVEGKLEKFYQGYCLLDQGFVKEELRSLRQGTHGLRRQAVGRRNHHPPLRPLPSRRRMA